MTDLLLRQTGKPSQHEVVADEHVVGPIALLSALPNHRKPCVWTIDAAFSEGHDQTHGFEATRDFAMQAFARRWFWENKA